MNSYSHKTYKKASSEGKQEDKSAANKQSSNGSTLQLKDNRPETIAQRKLQKMADSSPQTEHTAQLQAKTSDSLVNNQQTIQKKDNKTGLPDNLKSGVETLSGYSMDDVKVHRNSDKPAQLNAHAYAQGTDIHLAPGQEKQLPHEAWHVVQQKQGRVKPTKQLKDKVNINDDAGLEKEADVMGSKANGFSSNAGGSALEKQASTTVAQLNTEEKLQDKGTFRNLDDQSKNIVSAEKLGDFQYENEKAAGLGQQINTEGDVSWRSKVGSWFGEEGTWSKFLTATELYNKADKIEDKQKYLLTLKREAYEWLKNKEEKVKKKESSDLENDLKKYNTIRGFIKLTTSNHPDIITSYNKLLTKMSFFKEDIIGNRKEFEGLTKEYQDIDRKVTVFKATYPPAVNLHFAQEWAEIQGKKIEASRDVEVVKETKTVGSYLTVKNPTLGFNVAQGEVTVKGGLGVNIADVEVDEKTTIKIVLDSKGDYRSLNVTNGKLKAKIGDMEVELDNLKYEADVLTADSACGKINILGKEVGLNVTKAQVDKAGFDYEKITGTLSDVNLEVVKLQNPELTYDKSKNIFDGAFNYELDLDSPFDKTAKSDGKFSFEWSPKEESKRNLKLDKAKFEFGLLGQKLVTKDTSYDHKKRMLDAKEAELTLDLMFFKSKKFKGKDVSVGRSYFDFKELSLESDIGEIPFGPLSITPTNYGVYRDETKGYGVKAGGKGSLNMPKGLDVSAGASFEGAVAVYFKEPKSPDVELTKGNADLEFANPLAKLSKFLGDDWTNTRFELGASVPVFPGVSAIFGLYMQLLATLPDKIKGSALLSDKKLNLAIGTEQKVGVEGGVFGGVQAGSQLLLALAALLRAAGKFDMNAKVGYKKSVDLKPESKEKQGGEVKNETDGFYYSLDGGLKVGAYLDLVATALYFFKKTFTLELKEWNLGEFVFSNTKQDKLPDTKSSTLFEQEDLKDKLDKRAVDKNPGIENLKAEQLLDQKENQRYSGKEKEELLNIVKEAEGGRSEALKNAKAKREESKRDSGSLGAEEVFDNVALADIQFFDQYVDKFVTWNEVLHYLHMLDETKKLTNLEDKKKEIKHNLMLLKDVLTIPGNFKDHFTVLKTKFDQSYQSYSGAELTQYKNYLEEKDKVLKEVHSFKHGIHSQFWGDENIIDAKMRSWSIFGESPLEGLIKTYEALYLKLEEKKDILKVGDMSARYKMAEKALKEMNKEHQRRLEIKRSKNIKPLAP